MSGQAPHQYVECALSKGRQGALRIQMGRSTPGSEIITYDAEHNIEYICLEESHPGREHAWRQEEVVKLYRAGDPGNWITLPDFDQFFSRVAVSCSICGEKFWYPLRLDQERRKKKFSDHFMEVVAKAHPAHVVWHWERPG